MGTVYRYKPSSVVAVAGFWSGNTLKVLGDLCQQIYVKAATSTTVFDVSIIDPDTISIRKFTNITGVMNDLTPFPMSGINTIEIDNATVVDETFTVLVCVLER
uniref:Uncharacterized protein n=1 Tax=viral metagenome TaxID=1070528 RepID=A0A6M3J2Z2_9ZZZZ